MCKGQVVGMTGTASRGCGYNDWNRITRLHSHVIGSYDLSIGLSHKVSHMKLTNSITHIHNVTLAHYRVSSVSVVRASDLITEDRGFKSHLGLGFFRVYVSPRIYIIYHVVVVSIIYSLWRLVGCILICLNVTV